MKRCQQCILPAALPGVTLDHDQTCNFCRSYQPEVLEPDRESKLQAAVDQAKSRRKKYDCIVPLSGGRDSTYVLHLARTVYGMNPLVVNFDNEFRSEYAVKNIEKACGTLGVDLKVVRSKSGLPRKMVKEAIRSSMPFGLYGIACKLCGPCSYGYRSAVYRTAEEYQAPLILWGSSKTESTFDVQDVVFRDHAYTGMQKLMRPSFYRMEYLALKQRMGAPVKGNSIFQRGVPYLRNPAITEISMFDFVPWDRQIIKDTITTQLGWEKPPEKASSWRIDCTLGPLVSYCFVKLIGCTKHCVGYCSMIRRGQMTRDEALKQEETALASFDHGIEDFLGGLGLNRREIGEIAAMQGVV